jgi:hypothetical protein
LVYDTYGLPDEGLIFKDATGDLITKQVFDYDPLMHVRMRKPNATQSSEEL